MPAYNCAAYIEQTLSCMCNQSYSNIEIIVVNDGSKDETLHKINAIIDPRLKILNIENAGASSARNVAYQNSTGEYVVFFDADDLVDNDFLEKQLALFDNKKNVVVSGWGRFYKNDLDSFRKEHTPHGKINFSEWITNYWYNTNPMTNPGRIMIPKSIIEKAGYWDETLTVNDDLDFYTRIFLQADNIVFNPFSFLYYRSGINGLSSKKGSKAYLSLYNSVMNSVKKVLLAYPESEEVAKSCANMLQGCIYELYPFEIRLVRKLEKEISSLGGANLKPFAGGLTKKLNYIIGWKTVRVIKRLIGFKN